MDKERLRKTIYINARTMRLGRKKKHGRLYSFRPVNPTSDEHCITIDYVRYTNKQVWDLYFS